MRAPVSDQNLFHSREHDAADPPRRRRDAGVRDGVRKPLPEGFPGMERDTGQNSHTVKQPSEINEKNLENQKRINLKRSNHKFLFKL